MFIHLKNLLKKCCQFLFILTNQIIFLDEEDDEEESSQIRTEEANFEFTDFVKKLDIYCFK